MYDLAHQYEPALREFQAAYRLKEDPRVALNIGRTLHKLGRFSEALISYKRAGRSGPADTGLQKQQHEFTIEAQQNLDAAPKAPAQRPIVVKPTLLPPPTQTAMVATATANNYTRFDLGTLVKKTQPAYKRASLWAPVVSAALVVGAVGIAAAAWPRPWQPDASIPTYPIFGAGVMTAGGGR